MTRIYLVRHAQSEGNLYRRILGWYDGRLTELGRRQANALEVRLRDVPLDAVYTSDLARARETALPVAQAHGLSPRSDPAFREVHMGELANIPYGDLLYHHPDLYEDFFTYSPRWSPKGGESFQQVADRMAAAFFRVARDHPGETVAIFSHAMAIHCLQAALRGEHPSQVELPLGKNTALSCYEVREEKFRVLFENDAAHLPAALAGPPPRERGDRPLVWFRNMDLSQEGKLYNAARQEAWQAVHGSLRGFDGAGFLSEVRDALTWDRRSLQRAMWEGTPVGILQLSIFQDVQEDVGHIPFLYVSPAYRGRGIGVQLVGQAVGVYRAMGRKRLRLQCAPGNAPAQALYRRCGFQKRGQVPGAEGPLDLLELPL